MASTAVTTSMALQRARGDEKHAVSSSQHEVSMREQGEDVPGEDRPVDGQMGQPRGPGQDRSEERQMSVGEKKLGRVGIQRGMEKLLGGRDVDFRIFNAEVIAMNHQRRRRKTSQTQDG